MSFVIRPTEDITAQNSGKDYWLLLLKMLGMEKLFMLTDNHFFK